MTVKLNFKSGQVDLNMGAGGKASHLLIEQLFKKAFQNEYLHQANDFALLPSVQGQLIFTTDSYVINPYFFPGGDIGALAVSGTINDLVVSGGDPLYISIGLILEEGFALSSLKTIIHSIAETANKAGVQIVTGDTKVVEAGKGDGIYINTSGVGVLSSRCQQKIGSAIQQGDKILINGSIADHGMAVMSKRQNLSFECNIVSDAQPLNDLVAALFEHDIDIRMMRDPTRGGIAAVLNEWSHQYQRGFILDEANIPVDTTVLSACELFGLDPVFVANEGKVLVVVPESQSSQALSIMRAHPLGRQAAVIGEVGQINQPYVSMKTAFGGLRRVDWISGEQLPRIC